MPRGPLHHADANGQCAGCGETFPCPASVAAQSVSHQVMPSATVHAGDFEHQLRPIHESLKAFQHELSNHVGQKRGERKRHDKIVSAIKHLEQAMDALHVASQE
jgi:hypothetical protein